jgi:hypothetical protein
MAMTKTCHLQSASDEWKFGELIRQQHMIIRGSHVIFFNKIIDKSLRHFVKFFLLSKSKNKSPNKINCLEIQNQPFYFTRQFD